MLPTFLTGEETIPGNVDQLSFAYPVTIVEHIACTLRLLEGTSLENVRYAFIPKKQLKWNSEGNFGYRKRVANKIFKGLRTPRKKIKTDELFDLTNDFRMQHNLVEQEKFKPLIIKYKKLIYTTFKFYSQKKNKLLKGSKQMQELSEEDKKMLKSLGYL